MESNFLQLWRLTSHSPKGLDLVQSRSLRSLALTGQASSDGGAFAARM